MGNVVVSRSFAAVVLNRVACLSRGRQKAFKGRSKLYALYNIKSLRPENVPANLRI